MEWEYDGNPDPQVGSCYLFRYTDYKFWDDAMYQCRIEGGDLASVSGYDAQLFLQCKFISLFLCWFMSNQPHACRLNIMYFSTSKEDTLIWKGFGLKFQ